MEEELETEWPPVLKLPSTITLQEGGIELQDDEAFLAANNGPDHNRYRRPDRQHG